MRIAIDNVILQLQKDRPRGISRIWLNIIPIMKKLLGGGNGIYLLSREGSLEENFGLETYPIPKYTGQSLNAEDKILTAACKKLKIDAFLSTYHTRALGVNNLIVIYDLIPDMYKPFTFSDFDERRRTYVNAKALVCISENTKRDLCARYDMTSKKVEVAHLGVSKEFCPKSPGEIASFRKRYRISSNYIVLDGSLTKKRAHHFCWTFASARTGLGILSYGGASKKYLAESCALHNIPFYHIPWLKDTDVPVALSGAAGLVFPSTYEGFGLPVLEAMACGTPVLCSKVASLPEVGGNTVSYITNWDFKVLKNTLISFFYNKRGGRLAQAALARSKLFTWDKMAEKMVKLIRTLR